MDANKDCLENKEKNSEQVEEYSEKELISVKEKIDKMTKHNHLEILKILKSFENDVTINENRNGILINLTELKKEIIDKIVTYIDYIEIQENYLMSIEIQKNELKKNIK